MLFSFSCFPYLFCNIFHAYLYAFEYSSVISQARGLSWLAMRFLAIGTFLGNPLDGALEN